MDKIKKLYRFLERNRSFSYDVQSGVYKSWLSYYSKPHDLVYSLLHHAFYTQSQPKLDKGIQFFSQLTAGNTESLASFICTFGSYTEVSFENLFLMLRDQPGWGDKTAALFTKNVYQIHSDKRFQSLRFWNDTPDNINDDEMYLPVDEVIKCIFRSIDTELQSFRSINNYLKKLGYGFKEMEVWDDLWYWGFITQRGTGDNRTLEFNEGKYWSLLFSDKNEDVIKLIKKKGNIFISIITGK